MKRLSTVDQELIIRNLLRTDLFFLLTVGLGRKDAFHPWILGRCKEVEANPDNHLDIWSRGHYKSTIITFALTIQDILASHGENPLAKWQGREPTFGIFSFNRPIAKQFLAQIKREFEVNPILRQFFPDVIWEQPSKDAPVWSLDSGIILIRKSNPKEATIESWGLVDGQPTSKHFDRCIYDDVVTIENVRSQQMIEKTNESWELSLNLGAEGCARRYIGTRYHFNDTYKLIMERGAATLRQHPCTVDGLTNGEPVLLSKEEIKDKRRQMGEYTFNAQMLCNPSIDSKHGFKKEWLQFHQATTFNNLNIYILIDPANEKKKSSDYTVMMVVGLGPDQNYYVLEITRDKLSLTERGDELFRLHRKYQPKTVAYEKYGMQADIAYIKDVMRRTNYNFKIVEVGGNLSKVDRISKLLPLFEQERVYLPDSCWKTNYENKTVNLVDSFINEEYLNFPVAVHDDMLDALARITDDTIKLVWPKAIPKRERYQAKRAKPQGSVWSA